MILVTLRVRTHYTYVTAAAIIAIGLYVLLDRNLIKKVIGLNIFQTGIFLIFITAAYRTDGAPPIVSGDGIYVSPLPHVLVLTAIVVGVSVTALSLAMVLVLYETYGTVHEEELREAIDDE